MSGSLDRYHRELHVDEAIGRRWYRRDGSLAHEVLERRQVRALRSTTRETSLAPPARAAGSVDPSEWLGGVVAGLLLVGLALSLVPVVLPLALVSGAIWALVRIRGLRWAVGLVAAIGIFTFLPTGVLLAVTGASWVSAGVVHWLVGRRARPGVPARALKP